MCREPQSLIWCKKLHQGKFSQVLSRFLITFLATSCEFNFNIWCTTVLSLLGTQFGCSSSSWSGRKQISRGFKMKRGLWIHVNLWVDDTKTEFTALLSMCHCSALTKCNHMPFLQQFFCCAFHVFYLIISSFCTTVKFSKHYRRYIQILWKTCVRNWITYRTLSYCGSHWRLESNGPPSRLILNLFFFWPKKKILLSGSNQKTCSS